MEELRWKAYEDEKARRRKLGAGDISSDEGEKNHIEYVCMPCKKSYNSKNAYEQHIRSKKHKATLAVLGIVEVVAHGGDANEEECSARQHQLPP